MLSLMFYFVSKNYVAFKSSAEREPFNQINCALQSKVEEQFASCVAFGATCIAHRAVRCALRVHDGSLPGSTYTRGWVLRENEKERKQGREKERERERLQAS